MGSTYAFDVVGLGPQQNGNMKIPAQQMADELVAPQYRQPLKTLAECLDIHGWEHVDRPVCCGEEIKIDSFIGSVYFAECPKCGKFCVDVTGPRFGNGHVNLIDGDKVDLDTDKLWIAGVRPV